LGDHLTSIFFFGCVLDEQRFCEKKPANDKHPHEGVHHPVQARDKCEASFNWQHVSPFGAVCTHLEEPPLVFSAIFFNKYIF